MARKSNIYRIKKTKVILPLVIGLLLGIPLVIFALASYENTTKRSQPIITTLGTATIKTFSPQNNARDIGLAAPITIDFTTPLAPTEKATTTITINPHVAAKMSWSEDATALMLTPITPLRPEQTYTATVFFREQQTSWTFHTVAVDAMSEEDQQRAQTIADEHYFLTEQQTEQSYPWIDTLPLQKDMYFVFFDTEKKRSPQSYIQNNMETLMNR